MNILDLTVVRRLAALLVVLLVLGGCAEQRVRDASQDSLRDGNYEQAEATLQKGLQRYPESSVLRAGLVQTRTEALTRLLADAAAARAAGRFDDALALLQRAGAFDPGLVRVGPLMESIATERRQLSALDAAQQLAAQHKTDAALQTLADALKEAPRQPDLLALQRKLEQEQRSAQVRAAHAGLSEGRPISLDFRDAGLRTVLDVVSRNSGINFILDKDIKPDVHVTVFLRNAKVEEAIDLIVNTYQLSKKVIDSHTILIYPNTPEKQREFQEQIVRVFYLVNADAKGAAAFLRSMLKVREPFVEERTNMVALRETPETMELAERLISVYDADEPEVLLELEVMEINSNRLTELGIQFPDTFSLSLLGSSSSSSTSTSTSTSSDLTLKDLGHITSSRIGVTVSDLLINLKRTVGDVNTLSAPRIRVKNKEKAKVLVGDKIPLVTATTGTGGFVSDSVSYIDVGLKLDVEPTIYLDDEVAIKIALEVSSLGTQTTTSSGTIAYQIGTRNASTVLRLRDGQTQLLGGLISREERGTSSRIPGLGDLPALGRLFSSQSDTSTRTELVLAVTPHVVRNVRPLTASEGEMWVGTETSPRLRSVGGRLSEPDAADAAAPAAPATSAPAVVPPAPGANGAGVPLLATAPVNGPRVQLNAPAEVAVGDTFTASVRLQSDTALRSVAFELDYPKDRLAFVAADGGDFFRQRGGTSVFSPAAATAARPEQGVVKGSVAGSDGRDANGVGSLVLLRFTALQRGPLDLQLRSVQPAGAAGPMAPTPATTAHLNVK